MSRIYTSAEELIGRTPLLQLKTTGLEARILFKLECFNPGGSAKDRAAVAMLNDAENRGILKPGAVIIEPTSGNTGIGLALVGTIRGYRVTITGKPSAIAPAPAETSTGPIAPKVLTNAGTLFLV